MEPEDILLIVAVAVIAYDIIALTRWGPKSRGRYWPSLIGFAAFTAYYLLFVRVFLASDFTIKQVYEYSSSSLPWTLKLFASWGGSSGSLLMISFFIGIAYIVYRYQISRRDSGSFAVRLLGLLFIYFIILTLFKGPFQRFPALPPDGMGLNPQLQSVWMFYHPLVVFAGYAFVVIAFALTIAGMRGERGHEWLLDVSLKSAWLLFTIGIALGGLWAYQVLGWGGYWAWDPVETASLLPWLALTAYFHRGSKAGEDLFRESMVVLSFDSLLFLSALTRGGLLNSVHAYAFSPAGPALLICVVAATAYYLWLVAKTHKPLMKIPDTHSTTYHKLMLASSLSLLGIFAVCFIGVIVPTVENLIFGSAEATSFDFYNYVSLPFVLVFVIASMFCGNPLKKLPLYTLVVAVITAGAFILVGFPSTYLAVNGSLPLVIAAMITTVVNLFKVLPTRKIALLGRQLIHISVMVVLIGVFISSSMSSTPRTVTLTPSTPVTIEGMEVFIREPKMTLGSGSAYMEEIDYVIPEKSSMSVEVKVSMGGQPFEGILVEQFYPNYGLVSHPTILGDGVTDIYMNLAMDQGSYNALFNALIGVDTPPTTLTIQVARKPMTNIIWWGAAAMSVGIFGSLLATLKMRKDAPQA